MQFESFLLSFVGIVGLCVVAVFVVDYIMEKIKDAKQIP